MTITLSNDNIHAMFKALLEGLGDVVFPHNCILCSQYVANKNLPHLCLTCLSAIEFNRPPFCLKCSRHLSLFTPQGLCPTCVKHSVYFDEAWGIVPYSTTVQQLLHLFKFHQKTLVRRIFEHLLREFVRQYPLPLAIYDHLVPIPLHSVRMRERGYNQSLLIAQSIQTLYGIHILEKALVRTRPTQPQSVLGQKERWTNTIGAFKMNPNFEIKDKSILLIDDLLTTGATASQAAQTLKEAGAKRVGLFIIALAD